MLRITTVRSDPCNTVLKLEGKLLAPWVDELQGACRHACEKTSNTTLDLTNLSFVDTSGAIALRDLTQRGLQLKNCSPLVRVLLQAFDQ
ncbi:MAG: STAS domain-containing protein [Pirellulales bacterium]